MWKISILIAAHLDVRLYQNGQHRLRPFAKSRLCPRLNWSFVWFGLAPCSLRLIAAKDRLRKRSKRVESLVRTRAIFRRLLILRCKGHDMIWLRGVGLKGSRFCVRLHGAMPLARRISTLTLAYTLNHSIWVSTVKRVFAGDICWRSKKVSIQGAGTFAD
jgi:hypothetical protein